MYFFLTNHCKMRCRHCCFNAGPQRKDYMSRKIFNAGLRFAEERGEGVFLGGGEPTDHPDFYNFLTKILASDEIELESSGCITNGTNLKAARLLSRLKDADVFFSRVSRDQFHNHRLVDPRVYKWFKQESIQLSSFVKQGRARNLKDKAFFNLTCTCENLFLDWNGDIYSCGCRHTKFGNILNKGHLKIPEELYCNGNVAMIY
jgi:sulfatase maturation enzyme AslB (radical SAM superfamily)